MLRLACADGHHVVGISRALMQAMQGGRHAQRIVQRNVDRGALRNPNRRGRNLHRLPELGESVGRYCLSVFRLGIPDALVEFKLQVQDAVANFARRSAVVVRGDQGMILRRQRRHHD